MTVRAIGASLWLSVFAMAAIAADGVQLPTSVRDAPQAVVSPGTASIAGTITSEDARSVPMRRAVVTVTRDDSRVVRTTMTDDDGRFVVETLPQGRYVVSALKPGYLATYYGSPRGDRAVARTIAVSDGQFVTGINFKMQHGASISGRILDENGQPISCTMAVLPVRTINGVRGPAAAAGTSVRSDDRGIYRVYGLAAGDYIVAAMPPRFASSPDVVTAAEMRRAETAVRTGQLAPPPPPTIPVEPAFLYASVYFPGTPDPAGAATVALSPGEDREGVDFVVARVPVATLSGTVIAPDGQPVSQVSVTLTTANEFETNARPSMIPSDKFAFMGIPPGIHTLSARALLGPAKPGAPVMWASQDVTVTGRDVNGILLLLSPGLTVSGRVVYDTATQPSDPGLIRLWLEAEKPPSGTTAAERLAALGLGGGSGLAEAFADVTGAFKFAGVPPGRYTLAIGFPTAPLRPLLASAMIAGQDASELPVDIRANVSDVVVTLTDRVTSLSGTVRDASGTPTSDYVLVAFPVERQYWGRASRRVRGPVRPNDKGHYEITSLPRGEYFLAALTDIDRASLLDIATLERLVGSSLRVSVLSGESVLQDLKVK